MNIRPTKSRKLSWAMIIALVVSLFVPLAIQDQKITNNIAYAETEYLRPTSHTDSTGNTSSPANAYDSVATPPNDTYSTTTPKVSASPSITFHTWQTTATEYDSLTLYVNRAISGYNDDSWGIQYSTNGGSSWSDLEAMSSSNPARGSASVSLSLAVNLEQLQVRFNHSKSGGPDYPTILFYDIWTAGVYNVNLTTDTTGTQTSQVVINTSDNYLGGAWTFLRDSGSDTISSIIISDTGTVDASTYLSNLDLRYEEAATCSYEGTETLFGTAASFSSESATVSGSMTIGSTTQTCVYAIVDVASGPANDETIELQITDPSTQVSADGETAVSPDTAVAIADTTYLLTNILAVDIVDSGGVPVSSPSVTFTNKDFSWSTQQATGTLGTATQKIRVTNTTLAPTWTLSIAATDGPTAVWDSEIYIYDFNGSASTGRLGINADAGTVTPKSGCSTTGLTKQTLDYFEQGVDDSIEMIIAGATAETNCWWDLTAVALTQDIPAGQEPGTYTLDLVVSII